MSEPRDIARALRRAEPWTKLDERVAIDVTAPGLEGTLQITGAHGGRLGFAIVRPQGGALLVDVAEPEPFFGIGVGHLARLAGPDEIALLVRVANALLGLDLAAIVEGRGATIERDGVRLAVASTEVPRIGPSADRPAKPKWTTIGEGLERRLHQVARRVGAEWNGFMHEFGGEVPDFVAAHVFHHITFEGGSVADRFLAAPGKRLSADEKRWFEAQVEALTTIWEVIALDDRTAELRDIFSLELRSVPIASIPADIVVHDHVLARVAIVNEDEAFVHVVHPVALGAPIGRMLRQTVAAAMRWPKLKPIARAEIGQAGMWLNLLSVWSGELERARAASEQRDDVMLHIEQIFALKGARSSLDEALAAIPGIQDHGSGIWTWVDPHEPVRVLPGRFATHASLTLSAKGLEVVTFTRAHADRLAHEVSQHCGALIAQPSRREGEAMPLRSDAAPPGPHEVPSIESQHAIRALKERHYQLWIEVPLPHLGDKSPRQAIKTKRGRAAVEQLIVDLEHHEARELPASRYDVSLMRRLLGLA